MSNLSLSDLSSNELVELSSQELKEIVGGDKIIQIFDPFAFFVPNSGNYYGGDGGGGGGGGGNGNGNGHGHKNKNKY
jgi:hypothetical protein